MDTIKHIVLQEENEARYSRKHIDGYIREAFKNSTDIQKRIDHGTSLVYDYMGKTYYASKMARIKQLVNTDIRELVTSIFVGVAYCLREELFTSVTAQMAGRLHFSDRTEAITTVAEIMAVLCATDAYDIVKADKMASLCIVSRIQLSKELINYIEDSAYLPPMVCAPLELTSNYCSGYLSHKDSLILGSGNHHDGQLCLDVLNTINSVNLKLDTEFLSTVEEEPTYELDTPTKLAQWAKFKKDSYRFYSLMVTQGNSFYFTNRVDKRGRIYASGFHISPQGSAFKKASLELVKEELVTGVPS